MDTFILLIKQADWPWFLITQLILLWGAIALVLRYRLRLLQACLPKQFLIQNAMRLPFLNALRYPLGSVFILLGLFISLSLLPLPAFVRSNLPIAKVWVLTAWFAWLWLNMAGVLEEAWLRNKRAKLDKHTMGVLLRVARIAGLFLILLVGLQSAGIPLSGLLAFGGAGTLIVGFASKDVLANCAGALAVYLDRPFNVGDWIASPDKNIEGIVEHIGWRLTRIRRFNKQPLYVPNYLFSTIIIENPSRMSHRQIKETLSLRYSDVGKLPALVQAIQSYLEKHPDLDHSCTTFAAFNHLTLHAVECQLYCFTKTTEWVPYLRVQERVLIDILAMIEEHGCELAVPIHDLKISENPPLNLNGSKSS